MFVQAWVAPTRRADVVVLDVVVLADVGGVLLDGQGWIRVLVVPGL